jgi:hypothetical protein
MGMACSTYVRDENCRVLWLEYLKGSNFLNLEDLGEDSRIIS